LQKRKNKNPGHSAIIIDMTENKLTLKENPTLGDFQAYVAEMIKERGFEKETAAELFMLLLEECGEMAKAARKSQKIRTDKNSSDHRLDEEAADVFIYLLDICNLFEIDLEKAFREKEEVNKKRTWDVLK
jgi:NTP pyrophosphatase (non-canonical NTP hydrolase)